MPTHTVASTVTPISNGRLPARPVPFTRCPACSKLHAQASEYVEAHPLLAARIGPDIARERVESALFGLAILGQKPSGDIGLLLPRLQPAAHGARFSNRSR